MCVGFIKFSEAAETKVTFLLLSPTSSFNRWKRLTCASWPAPPLPGGLATGDAVGTCMTT